MFKRKELIFITMIIIIYYTYYMDQPGLPFHLDKDDLRNFLERASNRKLSLVITDNSTSMLSIKEKKGAVTIRLHRIFLGAGSDVLNEIADYIKHNRKGTPLVRQFIKRHIHSLKKSGPRKIKIITRGKYHDLKDIYDSVNREYFGGRITAPITWGTKSPKRGAANRTLGSYSYQSNLIRINPVLDSNAVPRYYMEFLVYHEMLHAEIGARKKNGRRIVHSGEFRKREREFRGYERAVEWEKRKW